MYLGNQPALAYTSLAKQDFTTSATTSYVLDNPVANENEIALFINFVRQEPTTAYTASGTSLTLTSATSASDDMYAIFLGKAVQTVNPPAGSVGLDKIDSTAKSFLTRNYRNIIINGDMNIRQRGTTATGLTSAGYHTIDRFRGVISSLGTWTMSQSTDVPSGQGFATSLKMDCTTADASPAAGDYCWIGQKIEGQNLQHLKKGTSNAESTTISFWVKATKTGTNVVEFSDKDNTRHICQSYTINSTNTWEKKTITFAGDTANAFNNDNGESAELIFWLGAGSTYTSGTLPTSWSSFSGLPGNRAAGQINHADSSSNDFYITGVQLEAGTTASDFEFLPVDVNLGRCQRYYQQITGGSMGVCWSTSAINFGQAFPVQMRATPTASLTALLTIDVLGIGSRSQSSANITAMGNGITPEAFNVYCQNFTGLTSGLPVAIITTGGEITFTSEL
jgi:hypothetical protein